MIRNKPKKVNTTPMRVSGVISKSPGIKKPFIEYAQTNLIHFIRSS